MNRVMADINNVVFISTGKGIVKEECIIPDELELNNGNNDISLDDSCKQTKETDPVAKRDKAFLEKIRKRISDLNSMKCSEKVKDAVVKNAIAPIQKTIKSQSPIQSALQKSDKSEWTSPTILSKSISKPQKTINSDTSKTSVNSNEKVSEASSMILKLSSMTDLSKIANLKPGLQSILKLAIPPESKDAPLILKLPMTEAAKIIEMNGNKINKSTLQELCTKEKQIVITKNNLTEFKKEIVDTDLVDQNANNAKRFFHAVCVTCKKLRQPDNENDKCEICQNVFHYECLRCRDTLSSKEEFYNHLKNPEFCTELHIPYSMSSLSYTLAVRLEKNQCTVADWKSMQELVSEVRKARIKYNRSKFNRIRSCCPVCDKTQPVESGTFYCGPCRFSSVFKCLTCNRNYTSYTGAIYHAENHLSKKAFFECDDCSFKHTTKRELSDHIRSKHLLEHKVEKNIPSLPTHCPNCNLVIKTTSYWKKHSSICRKTNFFKCVLCSENYLTKKGIIPHLSGVHEISDSKVINLKMKEIIQERNNQKEKKKRTFINSFITPFCINCNIIYGVLDVTVNYNCLECKQKVGVQCKACQKTFKKYTTAYNHIKNKCEKSKIVGKEKKNNESKKLIKDNHIENSCKKSKIISKEKRNNESKKLIKGNHIQNSCKKSKIVSKEKKNNNSKKKLIKDKICKKVKKNTKKMDLDVTENNLTLRKDEMQLDENNIKIEKEDIEVFDGLLDFENFEVIIPNDIN